MKNTIILLSFFVITFSCNNSDKELRCITSLKMESTTPQNISTMLDSVRYIGLETTDEALLGNWIGKIKKKNNQYYISCDRKDLFIFDVNGLFLKHIHEKGIGPGEYLDLHDFDVFDNGDILILGFHKLHLYNKDGDFQRTIPLDLVIFNLKIIDNETILLYSSGEPYAIYETDLSGKIKQKYFKHTQSTKLGRNIAFVPFGNNQIITHLGSSNDFILFDKKTNQFENIRLLKDDVLSHEKENNLINNYGMRYLYQFPDLEIIDGMSGNNKQVLFACGSQNDGFVAQVYDNSTAKIEHVISKKDIDDVSFTHPFFMEYACLSDADDCFITYVHPYEIKAGLGDHKALQNTERYKYVSELMQNVEEDDNFILIEFTFKNSSNRK